MFAGRDADVIDWNDLLRVAKELSASGVTPFAVGNQDWQQRILFNSIVLGVTGVSGYEKLLNAEDISVVDSPEFVSVLEIYMEVSQLSQSFGSGSWQDQVKAVAAGEAAGVFMGDWAKGEFINLGFTPGDTISCDLAPGTENVYLPVFDVFLLGKVESPEEIRGQKLLIKTLMDKTVSQRFNNLKGSLPPFREVADADLDSCSRKAVSMLASQDAIVRQFASFSDGQFHSALHHAVGQIWSGDVRSVATARDVLLNVLLSEQHRQKERSSIRISTKTD